MPPETVSGTKQIVTKPLAVHQTTQGRRIKKKTRRGRRGKRKGEMKRGEMCSFFSHKDRRIRMLYVFV